RVQLGPFGDPATDEGNLVLGQTVAAFLGRHTHLAGGDEDIGEITLVGLTIGDRVVLGAAVAEAVVACHVELALGVLGPMTAEAVLLENRRDVVDEADRLA